MTRTRFASLFVLLVAFQACASDDPTSVNEAIKGLGSKDLDHRSDCIRFLKTHYRDARRSMIAGLDCDRDRFAIGLTGAYAEVGEPAIPDLLRLLPAANKRQKVNIAHAFAEMGKRAKLAVAALHIQSKSEDFEVREAALYALGKIRDLQSVPLLATALQDSHADVRGAAIGALCRFEGDAEPVTAAIIKFVKDQFGRKTYDYTSDACLSLGFVGRPALKLIDKEVTDGKNPVALRVLFLEAINDMANHGKKGDAVGAIPILRKAVSDQDRELRISSLGTLEIVCYCNSDLNSDKHLEWLFNSERLACMSSLERVHVASIAAIFDKHRKLAIKLFNDGLRSSDPAPVRYAVAGCLGLGKDRPAVAFGLARAMLCSDPDVRWLAVRRVTGDARYVIAVRSMLWLAVCDEDDHCREDAKLALKAVGSAVLKQYLLPSPLRNIVEWQFSFLADRLRALSSLR